ncbi:expressed unknown protein [Seminavis robusta]|uniref:Uncharacterized protein n=1 Tax=Seminavis robusta TaxID=568900 RepID=A0A9N8EPN6_9STRA|nr:expressed unknown protein [Seminavis robusta]|eukprot:Sro1354_g265440.1 n/a (385) ;mRNA; r:23893-27858
MSPITESSATRIRYNQDGTRRQGKLLTLQGVTNRNVDGQVEIDHGYLYVHVASFLAWKHAQERNGVILPSLPQVLGDCDFDWSLESRDTQFSPVHGVRALVAATTDPTPKVTHTHNNNNYTHTHATGNYTHTHTMTSPEAQPQAEEDWQMPFGIVGSVYSSVTLPITAFGQGFSLPQTSGGAISGALENSQDANARAAVLLIRSPIIPVYVAKNITSPTLLSESSYLALGMASLLESLLLGGPIYFTVVDNPTASYLVGSALLCIISLTILLILPLYHQSSAPVSTLARQNGVADLTDASTRSTPFGSHESKAGFMFITRIHDTPPIPKKGNGRPRHGSTVPASKTGPMDASSQANETTFTRPSQQPETKSKRENHLDMGVHTV